MFQSVANPRSLGGARLLFVLACLVIGPPIPAQEDPGGPGGPEGVAGGFGETVDVVVVSVEAVVTDRAGDRVTGLGRDDFRLLVDGRETPVEYFSEVRDGQEVATSDGGRLSEVTPPEDEAGAPAAGVAEGEPAVTNHLVFIDDYFGLRNYRNTVLRGLRERLERLPAADRMAIVAFDGEDLDVLASWTSSREELARVLDGALRRPAHGLLRAHERRRRGEEGPWIDSRVQERELERVLTAVRSTLQIVPRPEGRKVLLLLSGGWPTHTVGVTAEAEGSPFPELPSGATWEGQFDDRALVAAMADSANLLGYTVYPVDVNGLRGAQNLAEAESTVTDPETGQPVATTSPNSTEILRQGTLRFLAHETGGRALLFAERARALESVVADTRTYYSFGFTPRLQGDGTRHEVRLEVRRPGLRVRARSGYRDVSRAAELDLLAEAALRFDPEREGGGGAVESPLVVTLGEPRRKERRTMDVLLRVDVPYREITLLPAGDALVARLEIRVAVRDRYGEMSEMARVPLTIAREAPPPPGKVLRWESDLTLRRERHDLVVSLYDAVSGEVMTERVSVEP